MPFGSVKDSSLSARLGDDKYAVKRNSKKMPVFKGTKL